MKELLKKILPFIIYRKLRTLKNEFICLLACRKTFNSGWLTFYLDYYSIRKHTKSIIYDLTKQRKIHHVEYQRHKLFYRTKSSDVVLLAEIFLNKEHYDLSFDHIDFKGILDLGANIGLFTLKYACLFPDTKFVVVEPESENFGLLKKNLEDFPNCILVNKGIWWREAKLDVIDVGEGSWAFKVVESDNGKIDAVSIDHLCEEYNISPTMIKMDIEGSEKVIFDHIDSFQRIKDNHIFIIETHERMMPGVDALVRNVMKNENYTETVMGEDSIYERM